MFFSLPNKNPVEKIIIMLFIRFHFALNFFFFFAFPLSFFVYLLLYRSKRHYRSDNPFSLNSVWEAVPCVLRIQIIRVTSGNNHGFSQMIACCCESGNIIFKTIFHQIMCSENQFVFLDHPFSYFFFIIFCEFYDQST